MSFDYCCESHGYDYFETIYDADNKVVSKICHQNEIGGESPQYFLCAHDKHETGYDIDRKKRSADESQFLSRQKRGGGDIHELNDHEATYCPVYLPNSCVSSSVSLATQTNRINFYFLLLFAA